MADRNVMEGVKTKMQKALEATTREFRNLRTGRASTALVEGVMVDYYNTPTQLKGLANISTPDPKTIAITPWDITVIGEIEKAFQKSDLGLTPVNDGKVIRIQIPSLTTERRSELTRLVKKVAEEGRISIRNVRHEGIDQIKKLEKDKAIPEDKSFAVQKEIQKVTDSFVGQVDEALKHKEVEIHQV